jgi:hypothetical protein
VNVISEEHFAIADGNSEEGESIDDEKSGENRHQNENEKEGDIEKRDNDELQDLPPVEQNDLQDNNEYTEIEGHPQWGEDIQIDEEFDDEVAEVAVEPQEIKEELDEEDKLENENIQDKIDNIKDSEINKEEIPAQDDHSKEYPSVKSNIPTSKESSESYHLPIPIQDPSTIIPYEEVAPNETSSNPDLFLADDVWVGEINVSDPEDTLQKEEGKTKEIIKEKIVDEIIENSLEKVGENKEEDSIGELELDDAWGQQDIDVDDIDI